MITGDLMRRLDLTFPVERAVISAVDHWSRLVANNHLGASSVVARVTQWSVEDSVLAFLERVRS